MFGPVGRVEQHLGKGKEYRQVSGRHPAITALTAMDHTVTSRPDELATPSTFHGSTGVGEKRLDPVAVGGTTGWPSLHPRSRKYRFTSSMEPETTMSRAAGLPEPSSFLRRFDRQAGDHTIDDRRLERGDEFIGAHGVDMALGHGERKAVVAATSAVARAWPFKASQTIDTEGMPMDSAAMAARITARRAEPQHPMPETTTTPQNRPQIIGQSPDAAFSSLPWRLPKTP